MSEEEAKRGRGRPSTYDPAYCQTVVDLGALGKSQIQIAVALGVLRVTMLGWAKNYPEFREALDMAKQHEQDWWENAGQTGLTKDKFNSQVWSKSVSARFKDDYTETSKHEVGGKNGAPIAVTISAAEDQF